MSCTYEYKGKKYSKDYVLRKLAIESLQMKDQNQSIQWLKDKLGMSDSEIIIVQGLISGRSLGRFKADGKILLSGFADTSVAYHEAFHRVFRLSLDNAQRSEVRNSFKSRKNWRNLIDNYRQDYPNLSDDDLIEEYLADEFADYVLNPKDYTIEQPVKSIFDRIINFIKSLLGLSKKDVRRLYRNIEQGKFKNKISNQPYRKNADKILIGNYEMTVSDKVEVVNEITRQIINRVAGTSAKALEDFVSGKTMINDFALLKKILQESIIPILNKWKPKVTISEENNIGTVINELLKKEYTGHIRTITLDNQCKKNMIEELIVAFEQQLIGIPNDDALLRELQAFSCVYNPQTQNVKYSAPNGLHDDMVISLAYAYYAVNNMKVKINYSTVKTKSSKKKLPWQ